MAAPDAPGGSALTHSAKPVNQSFERWVPFLRELVRMAVSRRRPRDPEAVSADILNDVFADWNKIHARYLTTPVPAEVFQAVLGEVVRLKTLNAFRRVGNQDRRARVAVGGEVLRDEVDPRAGRSADAGAVPTADLRLDLETVLAAVDYDLVVWFFFEEQTLGEIASRTGLSPSTIGRSLHRIEALLKKKLRSYEGVE